MMNNILDLPEDCLSKILSLTSPLDVLRSSAVSKQLLAVSVSDTVWEHFLSPLCHNVTRQRFVSRKEMFHYLSRFPTLLENDTMESQFKVVLVQPVDYLQRLLGKLHTLTKKSLRVTQDLNVTLPRGLREEEFIALVYCSVRRFYRRSFALDKWSGKICYMLGARALSVIWGSNPGYWSWEFVPESRFPECAVLKDVCWLEIKGQIHTTLLSPATAYAAYFVFKTKADSFSASFGRTPVKVSVSEIRKDGLPSDDHHTADVKAFYLKAPRSEEFDFCVRRMQRPVGELPVVRDDGWMEIEMGRYHVGANSADERVMLEMTLKEVEISHWKLVVYGFEVRPLC